MRAPASRGAARSRRSRPGPARQRERRSRWRQNPDAGALRDGGGQAGGGERSEPPGKRSAQSAKRTEARGIPARRAETACGLGRVARSRSDAPGIETGIDSDLERINRSSGTGWRFSLDRNRSNRNDGYGSRRGAAQPPRSAAPKATRSGKAGDGVAPRRNDAARHFMVETMARRQQGVVRERERRRATAPRTGEARRGTSIVGMRIPALLGHVADPPAVVDANPASWILVEVNDVEVPAGIEDVGLSADLADAVAIIVDARLVGVDAFEADAAHGNSSCGGAARHVFSLDRRTLDRAWAKRHAMGVARAA